MAHYKDRERYRAPAVIDTTKPLDPVLQQRVAALMDLPLSHPLIRWHMSAHTFNALSRSFGRVINGREYAPTIGTILVQTDEMLSMVKNMGPVSVEELRRLHTVLMMDAREVVPADRGGYGRAETLLRKRDPDGKRWR